MFNPSGVVLIRVNVVEKHFILRLLLAPLTHAAVFAILSAFHMKSIAISLLLQSLRLTSRGVASCLR
jgi:HKD family nuclease